MPTSEVDFRIFLILLPGFAAAYLVQALTVRVKQTDLEKIIEAFLFSFLIYVTFYLLHPFLPWFSVEGSSTFFRAKDLLALLLITLASAVLMILFVNKDWTRYLRRWGFTERTSRSSIWNDVFQGDEQGAIVQVELADGRSVQGIVRFYSDSAEESSIFLTDARWIESDEVGSINVVPINGPGILLTKEAKILSISFLYPSED